MSLTDRLAALIAAFNAGSLDVPDGLFDANCVFRLNGVAYEDTLGRPVTDPIVRLVGRGLTAYRFLAQAVRYAMPDARVSMENPGGFLDGTLRGEPVSRRIPAEVSLIADSRGRLTEVAVVVSAADLDAIRRARSQ